MGSSLETERISRLSMVERYSHRLGCPSVTVVQEICDEKVKTPNGARGAQKGSNRLIALPRNSVAGTDRFGSTLDPFLLCFVSCNYPMLAGYYRASCDNMNADEDLFTERAKVLNFPVHSAPVVGKIGSWRKNSVSVLTLTSKKVRR